MGWNVLAWTRPADAAVGAFIVLSLGAVAVGLCRQPARRIQLALGALVGAAALPILTAASIAPRWSLPVLPTSEAAAVPVAIERPLPVASTLPPPKFEAVDRPAAREAVAPRTVAPAPAPPSARWERPTLAATLAGAYAAGVAVMAGWWLLGRVALARLVRSARPAPESAREALRAIAGPSGDRVRLLESDRITSPCAHGWIRPVILLPMDLADGRDPEALRYALVHEWSHIDRGDVWVWNAVAFLGTSLFYQPWFWWLRGRLRLAQDELADARAAASGTAEDYAAFLVGLARSRKAGSPWPALGIGGRRSELHRRVVMIVSPREPLEDRCRPAWGLAAAATTALVAAAVSGLHLEALAQEPNAPPEAAAAKKADGETLHYKGVVKDKDTGKPIAGAEVTVRRSILTARENRVVQETHHTTAADGSYEFAIPPEQVAERYMYIELDVTHPDFGPRTGFGYSLSMTRKNEGLGERPFFESIELRPAQAITGKIETPDGAPAAGVDLLAYSVTDKAFEYGSFARGTTDADGGFRLSIVTPGKGVLWILPKDYAPESRELIDGRRGDLGTFKLAPGVRLTGRALDVDGEPIAGMLVEARRENAPVAGLPVADAVERTTETDADGRFAFAPLPPGKYEVKPTDFDSREKRSNGWESRAIPGVFPPVVATIAEGESPAALEMRESPHVVIEGGWVDSQGKPSRGWSSFVWGKLGDRRWNGDARPGPDGRFSVKVPRGLTEAQIDVMTNEHASARHRVGKDAPLKAGRPIMLGTLDHDVKDVEIVRYAAPLILIDARTEDGRRIDGFKAEAWYADAAPDGVFIEAKAPDGGVFEKVSLSGGHQKTEAIQDEQNDGRYRTSQLLPDREVKISVSADGFQPAERLMKLAEGATEEATFVLEPK